MSTANPYAPPRAHVSDVQVDDEFETAGRAIRLGAAFLDAFLIMCVIYVPLFIGAAVGLPATRSPATYILVVGWSMLGLSVGYIAITIYYVARNGQTLAKKWLGIKVVRSDGSKASLGRIFVLRNLVNWVLSLTFVYVIVDSLFIFGDDRQCLHDKMADTIVVVA